MDFRKHAEELVAQMTLEEKLSQMNHDAPAIPRLGIPAYNWWSECHLVRIDIDEVISCKEIQYVGIEARVFLCRAVVDERKWLFELKYTIRSHSWSLIRSVN